ncbi:hypothetical protein OG455_27330 [Kitasatospora sp. NBC_01287]|uniref:hypothetical protein n=1 Tax=Kitasatospora sp. NBC_01287 TaxID=2903573 RepID=UPI002254D810|nr:hypothetical protein [Kitasatospora sp. NBC_01287]MCX4749172.1 hypothetical protein [Kitasatospora sp. NBC_01287]
MDPAALAWLLSQLGPTTPADDLAARHTRLGSAREVALEVLAERRAALLAEPLRLVVDGVVTMDRTANLTGVERQIALLHAEPGPDDTPASDTTDMIESVPIRAVRRTR